MIGRAAIALLLAAEALAFYTVGEVLMRIFPEGSNELVSAPGFVVVAFVAFLTPVLLDWFAVEGGKRAATIGVVGLVVLYGALRLQYAHDFALWDFGWAVDFVLETGTLKEWIPPVVTSSILLLLTWAWAAWRARSGVWLEAAPRALAVPFAVVTLALLVTAGSDESEVVTRSGVVFYGVALGALACSQLALSGATIGSLRAGGVTTVMLVGTGAVAVLGVLLIGVLLDPIIDLLSTPVTAVGKAIFWVLYWGLLFPIAWVLTNFFEFIFGLLSGGGNEAEQIQPPAPVFGTEEPAPAEEGDSLASRIARYVLAGGAMFLGVAIVAGVILILAILRRRAEDTGAEAAESERAGSFGDDLLGAARNLFRREHDRQPTGEGAVRLYLEVLESARRAGKPRSDGQTPHEFAPVLANAFHGQVTDEITAAFEYARYAGHPPDEATLTDLRRRWEQSD